MLLQSYSFGTSPKAHQYTALELGGEKEYFAYLMEQGTGKTKVTIDNACMLYNAGRLNALVVIAPNGVHRKWIQGEIPKHLPPYIKVRTAWWASTPNKREQKALDDIYIAGPELKVYCFNTEALATERGLKEIKRFLRCHDAMLVVDESSRIKNPTSIRTKNIIGLRNLAKYRRILTGTPVTQSPLDVFSQLQFLSSDIFDTESYTVFRARYAELMPANHPLIVSIVRKNNLRFAPVMIATDADGLPIYKNLEELKSIVSKHSYRVLKKDCLDLPDKVYTRHTVEMSPEQKKVYVDLIARVKSGLIDGELITKPIAKLNVVMYAQQILCGIRPAAISPDGIESDIFEDPSKNPRVRSLLEDIGETGDQVIVWCRFTRDIINVSKALRKVYGEKSVVVYYGDVKNAERDIAVSRFQSHGARFFVGNPGAAGIGLDLYEGTSVHYYSNSFKLEDRLQSEDRSHRIGLLNKVLYTDYEVEGTVDSRILEALMNKKEIADVITGDTALHWVGA